MTREVRGVIPTSLRTAGPHEAEGEDRRVADGGARVGRGDDGAGAPRTAARVHHHVVDLVVAVEVVVEEQVARLEGPEGHVAQRGVLGLGGARDRKSRPGPGPLDQPRAVEAPARRLAAPGVGYADLGDR